MNTLDLIQTIAIIALFVWVLILKHDIQQAFKTTFTAMRQVDRRTSRRR